MPMYIKALLQENYYVIEAIDGGSALKQSKKHQPSLILLDISLPGLDGYQVLKELKEDASLRDIPVIALTARALADDREEMLAYGFDGYITKPVDHELLEKTIRGLMGGRHGS